MLSLVDVAAHYTYYKNEDGDDVIQNGLFLAAIRNNVGVAQQLIKAGCPLDEKDLDVSSSCRFFQS